MSNTNFYKIYNSVMDKIEGWLMDLQGADENEYTDAWRMFRSFANRLDYLLFRFNERQLDEIYEELKDILKELEFEQDEIDELMTLVKMLDRKSLEDLLHSLEVEFSRTANDIASYLEELEAYNE